MTKHSDLQQQLWEFVYELLSPQEAEALTERICSDPAVARAYAEVKLQTDQVRSALRHETPAVILSKPSLDKVACRTHSPISAPTPKRGTWRTPGNLLSTLLAASLLLIIAYSFTGERAVIRPFAQEASTSPVRVTVLAPRRLQSDVSSPFSVQTRDLSGRPLSTEIDVVVSDSQNDVRWRHAVRTDGQGTAQLSVPVAYYGLGNRLEFRLAEGRDELAPVVASLGTGASSLATYLTTDRRQYQPGETVQFRSVTLPSLRTSAPAEVPVQYEILDGSLRPLEDSAHQVQTVHGVGSGQFLLPADLPSGHYYLVARSPNQRFPETTREFEVVRDEPSPLDIQLAFAKTYFQPGDDLVADVSVRSSDGEPMVGAVLTAVAEVDSQPLPLLSDSATTSVDGTARIRAQLPSNLPRGEGRLDLHVQYEEIQRTLVSRLPIQVPEVVVSWVPESGPLVKQVTNQVYFSALDRRGEPIHLAGELFNEVGDRIAEVKTSRAGYGKFALTPQLSEVFRLQLTEPAGWRVAAEPLVTSSTETVMLRVRESVVPAEGALQLELFSQESGRSLVVSAHCGDVEVGRVSLRTVGDLRAQSVRVPLDVAARGIVQLVVYDYSQDPATPRVLARRLVYRRPVSPGKLEIEQLPRLADAPGEHRIALRHFHDNLSSLALFRDGSGISPELASEPASIAGEPVVLGVSVLDVESPGRWGGEQTRLPNYFLGISSFQHSFGLEPTRLHADFNSLDLHDVDPVELDLLLGFHGGGQRSRWTGPSPLDGNPLDGDPLDGNMAYAMDELGLPLSVEHRGLRELAGALGRSDSALAQIAPRVHDNLAMIRQWQRGVEAEAAEARLAFRRTMGRWLVGVACLALTVLAGAALLRYARAIYWVPSLAVAAVCLIMGSVWLGLRVPTVPDLMAPGGLAKVTEGSAADSEEGLRPLMAPRSSLGEPAEMLGAESLARSRDLAEESDWYDSEGLEMEMEMERETEMAMPELRADAELERFRPQAGFAGGLAQPSRSTPAPLADSPAQRFAVPPAPAPTAPLDAVPESDSDRLSDAQDRLLRRQEDFAGHPEAAAARGGRGRFDVRQRRSAITPLSLSDSRSSVDLGGGTLGLELSRLNRKARELMFGDAWLARNLQTQEMRVGDAWHAPRPETLLWEPLLQVPVGRDDVDQAPQVRFQPARGTKRVEVITTAHGPRGLGEWRDVVPLEEPLSIDFPLPRRVELGDQQELALHLENKESLPLDVRLHLAVSPAWRWMSEAGPSSTEGDPLEDVEVLSEELAVLAVRVDPAEQVEVGLPPLRAIEPGEATIELRAELPNQDLHRQWNVEITPSADFQSRQDAGWLEGAETLSLPLPTLTEGDSLASDTGYLYLQWRCYPSLAAELYDAARVLTLQRAAPDADLRRILLPPSERWSVVPSDQEFDAWDGDVTSGSLALAHAALNDWLDQADVASPRLRHWSRKWLHDPAIAEGSNGLPMPSDGAEVLSEPAIGSESANRGLASREVPLDPADIPGNGQVDTAGADGSLDRLDALRGMRRSHGGWSSPRETAQAIQTLTTDITRPALAVEDCAIQLLGPDGRTWARFMVPGSSGRPLVWEGWAEVDFSTLGAELEQLELRVVLEGAERVPYVWHAELYAKP